MPKLYCLWWAWNEPVPIELEVLQVGSLGFSEAAKGVEGSLKVSHLLSPSVLDVLRVNAWLGLLHQTFPRCRATCYNPLFLLPWSSEISRVPRGLRCPPASCELSDSGVVLSSV